MLVGEEHISLAILRLVELTRLVMEGAGASSLAALLAELREGGLLQCLAGKRVALVMCGGNIDPMVSFRVLVCGVCVCV